MGINKVSNQVDHAVIKWLTADDRVLKLDPKQAALREAVARFDLDLAEKLLRSGAKIDFPYPPFGNTLLLDTIEKAASSPSREQKLRLTGLIKWLAAHGASLNAVNTQGNSAMILAASYGDCELPALLCNMGADVNHINMLGESVFTIAAYQDNLPKLLKMIPTSAITSETRATFAQYIDGSRPKCDLT